MRDEYRLLGEFIRRESGYDGPLDPSVDLLDATILDSFSIVNLAVFVQEEFGVEFEPEDFIRANLATLSAIVALIDKRKAAAT